jgi:transposase
MAASRGVRRRDSGKARLWRETVAAWRRSGQSVRAFCAARGLSEPSFYNWRRELARRDLTPPEPAAAAPALKFVPVHVLPRVAAPQGASPGDPPAALEVVLPSGLIVRAPAGVEPRLVAQLVAALAASALPGSAASGSSPC